MSSSPAAKMTSKGLPETFELFEYFVHEDWKKGRVSIEDYKSINGYLINRTIFYQRVEMYDESLHDAFQEDFEISTKDTFGKANRDILRLLRENLRKRGYFIASDRRTVAKNFELVILTWIFIAEYNNKANLA